MKILNLLLGSAIFAAFAPHSAPPSPPFSRPPRNIPAQGATIPISGLGVNVHTEYITNCATILTKMSWVRFGVDTSVSWTDMRSRVNAYKAAGYKVVALVDSTKEASIVGHVRDILCYLAPDAVELVNEPDQHAITAATGASDAARVRASSAAYLPYLYLISPAVSTYDGATAQQWIADFISAGGMASCDALGIHLYPWNHVNDISDWATTLRTLTTKTVICTEFGICTNEVIRFKGSWTAANAASCYETIRSSALAHGIDVCAYDGENTNNTLGGTTDTNMGLTDFIDGLPASPSAKPLLAAWNTTLSTNGVVGVGG